MSVRRVMGIETEYGISVPGDPAANPMILSGHVVNAYASAHGVRSGRASWDYADEAPLRDARGFEISRALADPGQLTDVEDPTLANVVLTNGARLYVDHAHPEYSSPEVTNPRAAVTWDRAGELIMLEAVRRLQNRPGLPGVNLYKNNTDGKGASYGTHENYLMRRETPFADIVRHLVPFFVVRQVITGSGRVGIGQDSRTPGFQLSQRADFFEVEVGLETTLKRPIINTRDEPHAVADLYRRLHVIIGDANHCDVANLLKLGMTSLVLALIEDRAMTKDLTLAKPVATLHQISHDPTLQAKVTLRDGGQMTALELLWEYHDAVAAYLDVRGLGGESDDPHTAEVMRLWGDVLHRLETDPVDLRRRPRLGGQAAGAGGVPRARRPGLERPAAARRRHPVERRTPGEGAVPPARRPRTDDHAGRRGRGRSSGHDAAGGHAGVVPGDLSRQVADPDRGRVVGLGDLRRAGAAGPPAGADARAGARDQGARGRDPRP